MASVPIRSRTFLAFHEKWSWKSQSLAQSHSSDIHQVLQEALRGPPHPHPPAAGSAGHRSLQGTAVARVGETLCFSFLSLGESMAVVVTLGDSAALGPKKTHQQDIQAYLVYGNKFPNSQLPVDSYLKLIDPRTQPAVQEAGIFCPFSLLPSLTSQRKGRPIASLLGVLALGGKFLRCQTKEWLEISPSTCPCIREMFVIPPNNLKKALIVLVEY